MKKFIGILILSGYHTRPQTDMYWSKDEDKEVRIVRETMSRNKFRSIKQNIHLSDNTMLNKDDKFSKLTPIFDIINRKNIQFGIFADSLSIDEEMVRKLSYEEIGHLLYIYFCFFFHSIILTIFGQRCAYAPTCFFQYCEF